MRLSREEAEKSVAALRSEIESGGEAGAIARAAKALGIPRTTLISRVQKGGIIDRLYGAGGIVVPHVTVAEADEADKRAAARGELGYAPVLPGYEIESTATKVGDAWVKQKRAHGEKFIIPDGLTLAGVSAYVDAEEKVIGKWMIARQDRDPSAWIGAIHEVFSDINGVGPVSVPPSVTYSDLLTLYPVADLHLGMYAWARETGDDYDLEIARDLFLGKMLKLVERAPPADTAVILNIGDFFHSDTRNNRTEASGHALDVDSRWPRVVRLGIQLLKAAVEIALSKHKRVIVRNLPGNHDYHTSFALSVALEAYFCNDPRVTVDMDPSKFWFFQWGRVLLAATHGDMAKPANLPGIVAATQPRMWGETDFRFGFTGHLHHKFVQASELHGMIVEILQTLSPKDWWHASMGYCAGRSMMAVTFHKDNGEDGRVIETVPPIRRAA